MNPHHLPAGAREFLRYKHSLLAYLAASQRLRAPARQALPWFALRTALRRQWGESPLPAGARMSQAAFEMPHPKPILQCAVTQRQARGRLGPYCAHMGEPRWCCYVCLLKSRSQGVPSAGLPRVLERPAANQPPPCGCRPVLQAFIGCADVCRDYLADCVWVSPGTPRPYCHLRPFEAPRCAVAGRDWRLLAVPDGNT